MRDKRNPGALAGAAGASESILADSSDTTPTTARPQDDLSQSGLAAAFIVRVHDRVRYVAARNWWLIRDGDGWSTDTTEQIFDQCRAMLGEIAADCERGDAERLGKLSTINAVLRIARTDRAIAITMNDAVALLKAGKVGTDA